MVALSSTLQPYTVAHVETTAVVVVTVALSTPNDVLVKQSSADSVSQPSSGPSLGLGGKVGMRSGPTVMVGHIGSGPLLLIVTPGGGLIGGGGPGGRTPGVRGKIHPPMCVSSQSRQRSKNQ